MRKFTFVLIGLIALVACEAELETERANNLGNENVLSRNGSTISPDAAAALAVEFRNSILNQSGQTRGNKNKKGVASVYAWRSSEIASKTTTRSTASDLLPDTLLYIVNFEDSCGFALVSADAQIADVAAYVEKGMLTPDQEIENPGFKSFLEGYEEYARGIRDSTRKIADSLLTIDTLKYDKINNPFIGDEFDFTSVHDVYQLVYFVAPLLTTKWGQRAPYNNECPIVDYGLRSAAGCVAVAAAQVAAYHRFPSSYNGHIYNWDAILSDSTVSNSDPIASQSVAELIHDIGILANMNYYYWESSAYFPYLRFCWEAFGYQYYRPDVTPTFNAIKEEISNGRPVVMCGSDIWKNDDGSYGHKSHAWVVDGVAVKSHRLATVLSVPKDYIHCNWGWDGNCDGYFILGAFETRYNITTGNGVGGYAAYDKAMSAYYTICPMSAE